MTHSAPRAKLTLTRPPPLAARGAKASPNSTMHQGSLTALREWHNLAALTCPSQCLQHQVHQLLVHVLVDVDLWGEEDSTSVRHCQVAAAHCKGQKILWNLGYLSKENKAVLGPWSLQL